MARPRKPKYDDSPGLFDFIDEQAAISPIQVKSSIQRLKFISFGSGSSGNCAYIGNDKHGILIDAGVDPDKMIEPELRRNGIDMSSIGGIILTHDHGDHVKYAYAILRRNRHMRLYCTSRTFNGLLRRHSISRRIKEYHQPIFKEIPFRLSGFLITPFEVSHDGTDNVGYHITADNHTFVVATDMGSVTERADHYIRQANYLMLESNYDRTMLINGRYPEYLKARILGNTGHLDNAVAAKYLAEIYTPKLRNVFLCHLSNDNNTPEKALETVVASLNAANIKTGDLNSLDGSLQLITLPRYASSGLIVLRND